MPDKNFDILIDIRSQVQSLDQAVSQIKQLKIEAAGIATSQAAAATATLSNAENLSKATNEAGRLARELVTGNLNASTMGSSLGGFQTSIGVAALVGFQLFQIISHAADEAVRLATEYQKGSAELERQARKWLDLAKAAGDLGDVVKLGNNIQPELDALTAKLSELRRKELTRWQEFQDAVQKQFVIAAQFGISTGVTGFNQKTLSDAKKAQEQLTQNALHAGNAMIDIAQKAQAAWEKLQSVPLNQAATELSKTLDDLKAKQAAIDRDKDVASFQAWVRVGEEIKLATSRLDEFTKTQLRVALEADSVRAALQQADLKQLDKTDRAAALSEQLTLIQDKLKQLGVDAASPNEALTNQIGLTRDNAEEVNRLAHAWVLVLAEISKTNNAVAELFAAQGRLLGEEALVRARATGTPDDVYRAQYGLIYNEILEKRKKLGLDISADTINQLAYERLRAPERQKELADLERERGGHAEINNLRREESNLLRNIRAEERLITEDQFLTIDQKNARLIPLLQQEREEVLKLVEVWRAYLVAQSAKGDLTGAEEAKAKIRELEVELQHLTNQGETLTFSGGIQAGLISWASSFGTAAQQVSNIITGTLNTAISATSKLITDAIFVTGNWKQAFLSAAQSIVQNLIQIGIQMLVNWAVSKFVHKANEQSAIQSGAVIAGAYAPGAAAASIATSGGSAYAGAIAAAVAVAAILALLLVGFQTGGFTGHGGVKGVAGVVHYKEFVEPEPTVSHYGADFFEAFRQFKIPRADARALMAGLRIPVASRLGSFDAGGLAANIGNASTLFQPNDSSGGSSSSPGPIEPKIEIFHFSDPSKMAQAILNSDAGIIGIIDAVNGNFHKIRKRS